jgi:hypothetical protein
VYLGVVIQKTSEMTNTSVQFCKTPPSNAGNALMWHNYYTAVGESVGILSDEKGTPLIPFPSSSALIISLTLNFLFSHSSFEFPCNLGLVLGHVSLSALSWYLHLRSREICPRTEPILQSQPSHQLLLSLYSCS